MGKELVKHLPEFSLAPRTARGFGGLKGVFMNGFQGEVEDDISELAGRNVVLLDLRHRLTDVPATEGSLEVGEFDEGELGGFLAFAGRALDSEHDVLGFGGGSSSRLGA